MPRRRPRVPRFRGALLVTSCLIAGTAFAQGSSVLLGTVTDAATKKPVPDVVVTATSPKLQGEQIIVSNEKGEYRIPQLPAGEYTLRLEASGYKLYERKEIPLRLEQSIRLNVELLPDALQVTEIITADNAPPVDVTSSSLTTNVSQEFINRIANIRPTGRGAAARSFESIAEIAPGACNDTYGTSIAGTTSPENGYVIDNVSVNDPGFGLNGSPMSIEFIQEVNINTGGYMPEFGRATGGVVSALTKSGSNEFHGSVWANLTPGALASHSPEIHQESGTISGSASLWNLGDFGAQLGGPIIQDKLWFFAGLAPSFTRYNIERRLNVTELDGSGAPVIDEFGFTKTRYIEGTQSNYFADQQSLQYIGKLTYALNENNSITATVSGSPTLAGGPGKFAISDRTGAPETRVIAGQQGALSTQRGGNTTDVSLRWASSFLDKRILVDTTLGYHRQDQYRRASDGTKAGSGEGLSAQQNTLWGRTSPGPHSILDFESIPDPSVCDAPGTENATLCPVIGYSTGGPGTLNEVSLERYQGKVVGTLLVDLVGRHVFKAGLDAEVNRYASIRAVSGQTAYTESPDGTVIQDSFQFGSLNGPDEVLIQNVQKGDSSTSLLGAFIQDSWNIADLVTINAGLRYDTQTLVGGGKTAMVLPNQISPRIGLIFDPLRNGRSKVFANFARYYEAVPLDMVDRGFPGERQVQSFHDASICNPLDPASREGACRSDDSRIVFRPPLDSSPHWRSLAGEQPIIDPDLKPQSNDELVAGAEFETIARIRAGASYTRRRQNYVIEDMSRDEGATLFIGNPGHGFASDFPEAKRDYDAVTLYADRGFSDGWLAQVSYTWSSLRGNWEGLFRSDTGQLDPNINADFDLVTLLPNRTGPLSADATHQVKVFGSKEFQISSALAVNIGLSYRGLSGAPINYLGAADGYGAGEVYVLPRGAAGRLPWVHRIDGHIGVDYRLSKDNVVSITADAFNLFNFQAVTAVDQNYTFATVLPIPNGTKGDLDSKLENTDETPFDNANKNPNFLNTTAYQAPRTLRFGARLTF